jgi:tRNA (cmo5U34)-methyltransferase
MNDEVKQQFDQVAKEYDEQRKQLIPCFHDFYGVATNWVKLSEPQAKVLDLGAGTGLFSAYILQKYPDADLTLVDMSEEMLKLAQQRFKSEAKVRIVAADYTAYRFEERYDAVISSLSIHHLTHKDKRRLFHRVHGLLKDGGVFVNADQAAGFTPTMDGRYKQDWERAVGQSGLQPEAIAAAIERRKLDNNASVQQQLAWLQEAGFAEMDCVYKYNEFGVFYALKGSA